MATVQTPFIRASADHIRTITRLVGTIGPLEPRALRDALRAVETENTLYHDAILNVGQLPGNVRGSVAIALVYCYLSDD